MSYYQFPNNILRMVVGNNSDHISVTYRSKETLTVIPKGEVSLTGLTSYPTRFACYESVASLHATFLISTFPSATSKGKR